MNRADYSLLDRFGLNPDTLTTPDLVWGGDDNPQWIGSEEPKQYYNTVPVIQIPWLRR
jgi:hypothetical protein